MYPLKNELHIVKCQFFESYGNELSLRKIFIHVESSSFEFTELYERGSTKSIVIAVSGAISAPIISIDSVNLEEIDSEAMTCDSFNNSGVCVVVESTKNISNPIE